MSDELFVARRHLLFRSEETQSDMPSQRYEVAVHCVRGRHVAFMRIRTGLYVGDAGMWRARTPDSSFGLRSSSTQIRTIRLCDDFR